MIKITYQECKTLWDRKKIKDLLGQRDHCLYACKKLGVNYSKHQYIKDFYKIYKDSE